MWTLWKRILHGGGGGKWVWDWTPPGPFICLSGKYPDSQWWRHPAANQSINSAYTWKCGQTNKTASFQKEAMRTQVALWFFMKWNLYRVVSLCLNKQNVQKQTSWAKSTALKDCDQEEMIGFDCICLYRDTFLMTYHPSYTLIPRHVFHDISSVLHADRSLHGA